jgi:hypothetical protein
VAAPEIRRGNQSFRSTTIGVKIERDRQTGSRAEIGEIVAMDEVLRICVRLTRRLDREAHSLSLGQAGPSRRNKNTILKGCIDFQCHEKPRGLIL